MKTTVLNYHIVISSEKMQGKTVYNAYSPTLGVADWGKTIEEAVSHIQGAITCYLEALAKDHQPIPVEDTSTRVLLSTTKVSLPHDVPLAFA